jgi:NitT/TauT family transport system permease protein
VSWGRFLRATFFFVLAAGAWEAVARAGLVSEVLLPRPTRVGEYLGRAIASGELVAAVLVTMKRLGIGYALGLGVGIPLGMLTARSRTASDTLGLLALGLQALPSVCWAPLAVLWFGSTENAMYFVVVMGTLWSILLATDHGVRSVPRLYLRAARTMGARGLGVITRVLFPAALPFVVSGMKQGWAFAWRSLMAAEIYVTVMTGFGLGRLLHFGREFHAMDQVLGVMLCIIVVGLVVDRILFSPFERFLHRRWGTGVVGG